MPWVGAWVGELGSSLQPRGLHNRLEKKKIRVDYLCGLCIPAHKAVLGSSLPWLAGASENTKSVTT